MIAEEWRKRAIIELCIAAVSFVHQSVCRRTAQVRTRGCAHLGMQLLSWMQVR